MLEVVFLRAEKKHLYWKVFLLSLVVSFGLAIVNFFIGGISIFLVALVSLILAYPVTKFLRDLNEESLKKIFHKNFFKRYGEEVLIFWMIFLGVVVGMFFANYFGLTKDFNYEVAFVESISGNIVFSDLFFVVLFNNLLVAFFSFLLSFFLFAGLIFVVVWNASIVAYFLYSLGSISDAGFVGLGFVVHGLLEIGGYVWAGVLGAVLSWRLSLFFFDRKQDVLNGEFFFDCLKFVGLVCVFVFMGAFFETV